MPGLAHFCSLFRGIFGLVDFDIEDLEEALSIDATARHSLIVDLLIANDAAKLTGRGIIRQVYAPACGTGGMLALTEEALKEFNDTIRVELFGQELNGESYAI